MEEITKQPQHRRTKTGVVISDKMEKSISVRVVRHAMHPVYGKRIIKSKNFIVHDPEDTCHVGDKVLIAESVPISKIKRWTVVKIIERARILGGNIDEEA